MTNLYVYLNYILSNLIFAKAYVCFLPKAHRFEVIVSGFAFCFYRILLR